MASTGPIEYNWMRPEAYVLSAGDGLDATIIISSGRRHVGVPTRLAQSFRVLDLLIRASELTRLSKMDALDRPVLSRSSTTGISRCRDPCEDLLASKCDAVCRGQGKGKRGSF